MEEATQAALEASAAAEAQHDAMYKQLAADKRTLQDQSAQVSTHPLALYKFATASSLAA